MERQSIQNYRRTFRPLLLRYLRATGREDPDGQFLCPNCGKRAVTQIRDLGPERELSWHCPYCGDGGDTVDLVLRENPRFDETAAIRSLHRALGMKITTLEAMPASRLMQMDLKAPGFLVEGLLGKGLHLLSGASKIGKSWLVLQLADRVSKGLPLWDFPTKACQVLYISLEDTLSRLQDRLQKVTEGEVGPVYLCTETEMMNHGFEEQLTGFLSEHPQVKLVIVDTLQKIRELGRDNYSYAGDYAVTGVLKNLADRFDLTILLVHHNRKMDSQDPIDRISGTMGIAGGVDGYWILQKRSRSGPEATMTVGGRDLEDRELELSFDRDSKHWRYIGCRVGGELTREELLEKAAELSRRSGGWEGTVTQLARELGDSSCVSLLGRELSAAEAQLAERYGVRMSSRRTSQARILRLEPEGACHDDRDRPRAKQELSRPSSDTRG